MKCFPLKARGSQIEHGEVTSVEVIARYVKALGGRLDLVADFGDRTVRLPVSDAESATRRQPPIRARIGHRQRISGTSWRSVGTGRAFRSPSGCIGSNTTDR